MPSLPSSVLAVLLVSGALPYGPLSGQAAARASADSATPRPQTARADYGPQLVPGVRVRLTLRPDGRVSLLPGRNVGMLYAADADSVQVRFPDATGPETLPWTVVSRLEVSRGVNTPFKVAAVTLGAVGGALLGYKAGRTFYSETCSGGQLVICTETTGSAVAKLFLAGAGGAIGGVLGKMVAGRERWAQVAIPRRVSVWPHGRGGTTISGIAIALTW
ncbi:MAG: hypothetical protein WKG32_09815 [Gemmatimonadaceae bacterium]